MRLVWRAVALVVGIGVTCGHASAQEVVITGGGMSFTQVDNLSGFILLGPGTRLQAATRAAAPAEIDATTDLSRTITTDTPGFQPPPLDEVINGVTYSSVWVDGSFNYSARPFSPLVEPEGTRDTFMTPFTMQGTLSGYSDQAKTHLVFSVSLSGRGNVQLGFMDVDASGHWLLEGGNGETWLFAGDVPAPWQSTDIGAVGQAGSASQALGTSGFYVNGSGADIWGTSDAFQFTSQALAGDGDLIARLDQEQNTSPYTKAGLMLRQSLDADSAHVILDRKPDGVYEFMTRSATGAQTTFLASASGTLSFMRLSRTGNTVTASISVDGTAWSLVGSTTFVDGPVLAGLAVTSHDNSALNVGVFDLITLTPSSGGGGGNGPLPQPWQQTDIGNTGLAGSATFTADGTNGSFTIRAAGSDIWGNADSFHYVYVPMNGAGDMQITVNAITNTSPYAKAGLMLRASTDPGAAEVILDIKPDGGIEFMERTANGEQTTFIAGGLYGLPAVLNLHRDIAADGSSTVTASVFGRATSSWQTVGTTSLALPVNALAGIAVTSHDTSTLVTAAIGGVEISRNLLDESGFEGYSVPSLGPGWVSDNPLRSAVAKSDTSQPHSGAQNGICPTDGSGDCGIYQEITAPAPGNYQLSIFANSDRTGAYVGVNVNGQNVGSLPVDVRGFDNYGDHYCVGFQAKAGDVIRVWVYSPATPGYVVVDDATLVQSFGAN